MKAFDADVLTLIGEGDVICVRKASLIAEAEQAVPIIVAEQIIRGRFNTIRQAEAGKSKVSIDIAYALFEGTLQDLRTLQILGYSPQAELLVQAWRKQKIRVGISDLRIAALCIIHSATLISRNRRDFDQVPGLLVEYW
jgi:tRNA(fMet)-specific endonuclease VapC